MDFKFEEDGGITYENQGNNESNEFYMDYLGIKDNNTFYENYNKLLFKFGIYIL